ncbi:nucleotide exchange factor GrpE [Janibacter cremeus]|uniref:nucleotide exchange factor GrpE n=1 Tax=Janibacter cremeus TaxID=1285192 RepID=UPI0023F81A8A|nr:nucleotide exchange factor GrpE [Janibacter cremeus]WEV77050.1 nucleotide exchange factor GrpE [Janibacter cremeus]
MTDPNEPIDPEVTADADTRAEEPVDAEVVPEEQETAPSGAAPGGASDGDDTPAESDTPEADVHPDTALAAERLEDLLRLQAEYVNYKRRVDRDRADIQIRAAHDVLETLLPVLDEIQLADQHGDLPEGSPVRTITDKLQQALGKYGLERVGAKGEPFDPNVHEALMHAEWDPEDADLPTDTTETTVVTVLQPGYRAGDRVLRAARVAVADPQ